MTRLWIKLRYIWMPIVYCWVAGHDLSMYPIYNDYSGIPDPGACCKRCGADWGEDLPPIYNLYERIKYKIKGVFK